MNWNSLKINQSIKCYLEELNAKDAKDDEEGAADEDNVADGLEGGEEGLHHQLQPGGPVDHSDHLLNI